MYQLPPGPIRPMTNQRTGLAVAPILIILGIIFGASYWAVSAWHKTGLTTPTPQPSVVQKAPSERDRDVDDDVAVHIAHVRENTTHLIAETKKLQQRIKQISTDMEPNFSV